MPDTKLTIEEKMKNGGLKNHFSKVLTDTVKTSWALIIVILLNVIGDMLPDIAGEFDISKDYKIVIIAILVVLGCFLAMGIVNFLHWRKTYIIIEGDSLVVNNNYLFRKQVKTVRLDSIATVNYQRGIFEYVFGTYRLQIDANSSVTADKTDFNLVFDKETAEQVKNILTRESQKDHLRSNDKIEAAFVDSENSSDSQAEAQGKLIYQFTFGQVVRHCFLSISIMVLVFVFGSAIGSIALSVTENEKLSMTAIILPLVLVVVPLIWSQISPFFHYYGFRIEKVEDRAVVSYGLVTKRQFNLPLNKTNAIIIHQPLFARIFGYYYGELINVGMGDDDVGTPIFCLCVKKDEMERIIKELKPELQIGGLGEKSPSSSYIPTSVSYILFALAVLIVASVLGYWWAGLITLVVFCLIPILSYKTKALAVLSDKAIITAGVFHKRTMIVPNEKIQDITLKSGPISRRLGLANGTVTILASAVYSKHEIGYFKTERFDKLFENIVNV